LDQGVAASLYVMRNMQKAGICTAFWNADMAASEMRHFMTSRRVFATLVPKMMFQTCSLTPT
jgi:hypothetical protein